MNMPVDAFLTALYVMIDDWYQAEGARLLAGKAGSKPVFSDSEVLTLSVAQHWLGFESEREWLRFIAGNFLPLFPRLVSQGEFNRRARNLCWLLGRLHRSLIEQLGLHQDSDRLLDGTPIHVRHWRRCSARSLSFSKAALGYCATKREYFYGYRLVALTTWDGVITDWTLIGADVDEREGALDLLGEQTGLRVIADKGFLDQQRQAWLRERRGIALLTPKRKNQKEQLPRQQVRRLNRLRQRVEATYSQAKACFGLEKPRAKTLWGLLSRLLAKVTGMTVAAHVNLHQGRSPLVLASFSF